EKSFENSPWQTAQFCVSTMVRCGTGAEPSTENVTTGLTAASVALTCEVSCTVRRASAPNDHVPVAVGGMDALGANGNAPWATGPTSGPDGEVPNGLPFNTVV